LLGKIRKLYTVHMIMENKIILMIDTNTPQPVILIKSAIVDEITRIYAPDVQGDQSLSMVQSKVVNPWYEPQNGMYETEYDGMTIALGDDLLVNFGE
jgi:hypothetical protein